MLIYVVFRDEPEELHVEQATVTIEIPPQVRHRPDRDELPGAGRELLRTYLIWIVRGYVIRSDVKKGLTGVVIRRMSETSLKTSFLHEILFRDYRLRVYVLLELESLQASLFVALERIQAGIPAELPDVARLCRKYFNNVPVRFDMLLYVGHDDLDVGDTIAHLLFIQGSQTVPDQTVVEVTGGLEDLVGMQRTTHRLK